MEFYKYAVEEISLEPKYPKYQSRVAVNDYFSHTHAVLCLAVVEGGLLEGDISEREVALGTQVCPRGQHMGSSVVLILSAQQQY